MNTQTDSIQAMETTSENLESSITNISKSISQIRNNTHEILSTSKNITSGMNANMDAVTHSSQRLQILNNQVQNFKGKIDKIGEIVNLVKDVATQSNLLALNASIEAARAGEAGRGFAIVADQVRQMASNTASATQDIVNYVEQLNTDIQELAESMENTAVDLADSNHRATVSLHSMEQMNMQMEEIMQQVDHIFKDIDTQKDVTSAFTRQIEAISASYQKLSENCIQSGRHVFQIGRYVDKTRSDLVRGCSAITEQDWLRVFEVDHFILTWRVYNNIVGFEHLQKKQVDNPSNCKLGKWIQKQTDPALTQCLEFKDLVNAHNELHRYATKSWTAKESSDDKMALTYFQQTYEAFIIYQKALQVLQNKMHALGYWEQTEIVHFQEA